MWVPAAWLSQDARLPTVPPAFACEIRKTADVDGRLSRRSLALFRCVPQTSFERWLLSTLIIKLRLNRFNFFHPIIIVGGLVTLPKSRP
jgi:hypothetical protein